MMMRLSLLIVVIATHSCRYSTATTIDDQRRLNEVLTDLTNSICHLGFVQQAYLYLDFCKYDGFDKCGKL